MYNSLSEVNYRVRKRKTNMRAERKLLLTDIVQVLLTDIV